MDPNKAILLYIETATDNCSIALSRGSTLLGSKTDLATRDHATVTTIYIQELLSANGLKPDDLSAVILSEGPGSYTSLRVGMSVAKGLCYGLDIPLITVNTLYSLALSTSLSTELPFDYICPMIDARRMEVYASLYDSEMKIVFHNQALILEENTFNAYLTDGKKILFCGNGATKALTLYKLENIENAGIDCRAENLLKPGLHKFENGKFSDLAYFSPNYIKSPNITISKKKLL